MKYRKEGVVCWFRGKKNRILRIRTMLQSAILMEGYGARVEL